MKKLYIFIPIFILFVLSLVFIYPIFQGLIILPLDLLVSNYSPWGLANTILLKNSFMQDSIIQLFPWRHLVYESLIKGVIPFWNPYQFLGMPFMASMKPMVFYPLNLFFHFGEITSWHILLFFQLFGSGLCMYLFVKELTKNTYTALLSAICFSYSSLMVGFLEFGSDGNAIIWLPLFLFIIKKYIDSHKRIWTTLCSIVLAFAVFAGHLQYLAYELIVTGIFIFAYGRKVKTSIQTYFRLALAGVLGFGVSVIQLFPSLEMYRYSYRGNVDSYAVFSGGLLKFNQLARLFAPDFFGHPMTHDLHIGYIEESGYFGVVPLFFVLWAMIKNRTNWYVRFFTIIFICGIFFSLDGIAQLIYLLKIPLISNAPGGRIFFVALFAGSILAGLGLVSFIPKGNEKRKYRWMFGYIFSVMLLFGISFACTKIFHMAVPSLSNLKFPIGILVLFGGASTIYIILKKRFRLFAPIFFCIAILVITYFDLFRLGYRFLTFSNSKFLYPNTNVVTFVKEMTQKSLGRVYGLGEPELPTYFGVYSIETYNAFYSKRTAELLQALNGKDISRLPFNKYVLNLNENLKYILDFTGTEYIITGKDVNPALEYFLSARFEKDITKVFEDNTLDVYKNNTSIPRFGVYYDVKQNISDNEALQLLKNRTINFQSTVFIDTALPIELTPGTGSAELISTSLNSQTYLVYTDKPALFYVSDTYFPGWKVTVNGKEERIYRTNYNFRSVLVPSGNSKVEFSYKPTHWSLYVGITCVSIFLIVLFTVL